MIGEKIKKLRKQKKVSLREMEKETGICYGTLFMIENNKRQPKSDLINKLSDYFNVPTSYLLNDDETIKEIVSQPQYTEQQKNCIDMLMQLNSNQLNRVEAYLTAQVDANEEIKKEIK